MIVAATSVAYRLDSSGVLQQTYTIPGAGLLFGMNLDPDGTSFWTGDLFSGAINRIDIATGAILKTFNSAPLTSLAGLAVVGEIRTGGGSGTITVTKDLIPSTDSGRFNLQIDAATAGTGGNVGDGGTTGPIEVTVGNHDVAETAGTGTTLTDYNSSISCTLDGGTTLGVLGAGPVTGTGPGPVSVPVANGDKWTCVITNTRKTGTITVTKALVPGTDPGKFNLKIDTTVVKSDAGDTGTSGPITVNTGNHDVSEAAGTGTTLADYTSSISCTEDTNTASPVNVSGSGPASVPVAEGDAWTCVITNTRNGGGTTITDLSQVHAWIGLKNSDDQGTQFDLLAELQKNGSTVASGLTRCITGLTRNASQAKEALVNWNTFAPITVAPGDIISIVFSTRIGTTTTGAKCAGPGGSHNNAVGLRLYYDSLSRPSRFDMTVGGSNSNEYLHSDGGFCDTPVATKESQNVTKRWFDSTAPTLVGTKCKDSSNINFAGGNLYKVIGTWYQQ